MEARRSALYLNDLINFKGRTQLKGQERNGKEEKWNVW